MQQPTPWWQRAAAQAPAAPLCSSEVEIFWEKIHIKLAAGAMLVFSGQGIELDHIVEHESTLIFTLTTDLWLIKEVFLFLILLPSPARGLLVLPEVGENVHQVVLGMKVIGIIVRWKKEDMTEQLN